MTDLGLAYIGEGLAFAALCGVAAWLEVNGKEAGGLWFIVVLWSMFFGPQGVKW